MAVPAMSTRPMTSALRMPSTQLGRMVNSRLAWYLKRHMVITEYQSGFRRRRSTVDNLVTLETSIRDTFVGRKAYGSHIFLFGEGL